MSITYRKALVLVKNGAGDAAPTASSNAILVSNFAPPTPNGQLIDRRVVTSTLSPSLPSIGAKTYTMSFDVELRGIEQTDTTGVKVPEYDPLLIASGLAVTATGTPVTRQRYTPDSDYGLNTAKAVTVYAYQDGLLYKLTDARVDFTLTLVAGEAGRISFSVTGEYNEPTDVALPSSPGYDATTVPGTWSGSGSFTFGGTERCLAQFTFSTGNTISPRICANGADGVNGIYQTDRNPGGTIDPEMELVATENYLNHWSETTTKALVATVDGNDVGNEGNKITVTIPKAALISVGHTERNGLAALQLGYRAVENTASGDDEFTIDFE